MKGASGQPSPHPCRSDPDGLVLSPIVVEQEQIGPNRYIATLGVLFDGARRGESAGRRWGGPPIRADVADPGDDVGKHADQRGTAQLRQRAHA